MINRIFETIRENDRYDALYYVKYFADSKKLELTMLSDGEKIHLLTLNNITVWEYIGMLEWGWNYNRSLQDKWKNFCNRLIFLGVFDEV